MADLKNQLFQTLYIFLMAFVVLVPFSFFSGYSLPWEKLIYFFIFSCLLLISGVQFYSHHHWRHLIWIPLFFGLTIGILFSGDKISSLNSFLSLSIKGIVLAFCVQQSLQIKKVPFFLGAILLIGIIAAGNGILEKILGTNFPYHELYLENNPHYHYAFYYRGGISGPIGHPLVFSAFLASLIPVLLFVPWKIEWKIFSFLLFFTALVLTEARTGVVAVFCGLTVSIVIYFWKIRKTKIRLWMFGIMALLGAAIFLGIRHFHGGHFRKSIFEENHRVVSGYVILKKSMENPFLGLGLGQFPVQYENMKVPGMDVKIKSPDNQYFRWLAELGWLGLAGVGLFFIFLFKWGMQIDFKRNPYFVGVGGGIVSGLTALLFFDGFDWMPFQFVFWTLVGVLLAGIPMVREEK